MIKTRKKIKKTLTQKIMDFYGWVLFFCVYFGLIAVTIIVISFSLSIKDISIGSIWNHWDFEWKITAVIFYVGGFSLYSWVMYLLAMKFQVLSAMLQAKMIKSKIWAENMRFKILKEYQDVLEENYTIEKDIKDIDKVKTETNDTNDQAE